MIRLLLEPVNLLILDEPTNHLDMPSKDVLKEAIKAFDGTAIIVSHDRDFLDGLVSKVYEFGGGQVKEHIGGIYDYLRAHNAETIHEALNGKAVAEEKTAAAATSFCHAAGSVSRKGGAAQPGASQPATKESWEEHKEKQKKLRKAQRAVEESESKDRQDGGSPQRA
jgi:ATP-binding cassette subfamily F protein 3